MSILCAALAFEPSVWNTVPGIDGRGGRNTAVVRAHEAVLPPSTPSTTTSCSYPVDGEGAGGDIIPWRTIAVVADAGIPSGVQALLVTDSEVDGRIAWTAASTTTTTTMATASANAVPPSGGAGLGDGGSGVPGPQFGGLPNRRASTSSVGGGVTAAQLGEVGLEQSQAPHQDGGEGGGNGVAPNFSCAAEGGSVSHASMRLALQPRVSREALDVVAAASPHTARTMERLLRRVRPLSFCQPVVQIGL